MHIHTFFMKITVEGNSEVQSGRQHDLTTAGCKIE